MDDCQSIEKVDFDYFFSRDFINFIEEMIHRGSQCVIWETLTLYLNLKYRN